MPEAKRVFAYNGPVHHEQAATKPEASVSPENGLQLIKAGFLSGRMHVSEHFKRRGRERNFDTMHAHAVILSGTLRGLPSYCENFENWKYRIISDLEDDELEMKQFEIVVALDPREDYEKSPLIILITGYWR